MYNCMLRMLLLTLLVFPALLLLLHFIIQMSVVAAKLMTAALQQEEFLSFSDNTEATFLTIDRDGDGRVMPCFHPLYRKASALSLFSPQRASCAVSSKL